MERHFSDLPRASRTYLISIWIVAAVFSALTFKNFFLPSYAPLTAFELIFWAGAVILSESLIIYLPASGCLSIGTAIDIPIILMYGPALSIVYGIIGALSSSLIIRKTPLHKVLFNIALFILAMGISSWVYHKLASGINFVEDPSLIAVFALTVFIYFILNSGLLSIVIGLSDGISPKIIWVKNHSWTISYLVVLASIGYLMVMVNLGLGKWAIVVLLLPVLLTRKIYSQYLDLQKMQGRLVHSERLAAVGQLAAGISHEIANPIGIIMGYSDYLLKSTPSDDSKFEDLKIIRKEAERCKQTLQDFSDFSRPVAKFQSMNVNNAVQNSINLLKHESKSRRVEVTFEKAPNLPKILGDIKQLEQVFINIMLNAFQAMPEGGCLKIKTSLGYNPVKRARPFMSRMWKREGEDAVVFIEFEDTGGGIPKENIDQLFMPFFTSRSQEGGRGMGLYISHQILKEHDGDIAIESELEKGTLVSVTIPLQQNK